MRWTRREIWRWKQSGRGILVLCFWGLIRRNYPRYKLFLVLYLVLFIFANHKMRIYSLKREWVKTFSDNKMHALTTWAKITGSLHEIVWKGGGHQHRLDRRTRRGEWPFMKHARIENRRAGENKTIYLKVETFLQRILKILLYDDPKVKSNKHKIW